MRVSRRTQAIVVGSVGFHALAIVVIAQCSFELPAPEARESSAPRVDLVEVDVLSAVAPAVEVLVPLAIDDTRGKVELASASNEDGRSSAGNATLAAGRSSATGAELGQATTERGGESLRMRGRRHDLRVPGSVLDRILDTSKPLPIIATDPRLRPSGGGEHRVRDLVTTMRVEKDGTAHLDDAADVDIRITLPITSFEKLRRGLGHMLTTWRDDPYRDQRAERMQDLPRHITAVPGACEKFGDISCVPPEDRPMESMSGEGSIVGVLAGKLDITASLHRKFIGDPYASRKLKLLDTTREARAQIGATHRSEQRGRAAELVQRNIDALWRATANPAERRAALFTLWDECDESESLDGEAGQRARAIVIGWIRAKLPAGSKDAYTAEEIARLDAARTSRQHFVPY